MKRIEELGISPWPWRADLTVADEAWVEDSRGNDILRLDKYERMNTRLIAAAPDMYICLHEAVTRECASCHDINDFSSDIDEEIPYCKDCKVKRWRAALAKAAGEEVAQC